MPDSITVEPMTASLRDDFNLHHDPARLAIVLSTPGGKATQVLFTTSDYRDAYINARALAETCAACVLTASSYRPTVVGADLMPAILANTEYAPLDADTPHLLGMFGRHCPDCAVWLLRNTDDAQWITGRVLGRDERATLTVRGVRVLHTVRAPQLGPAADVAITGDLVMWHPRTHQWDIRSDGLRPGAVTTR
jgi:hypothetical protein